MSQQEIKQKRVKIFDELSKIVDPEIDMSIVELELIDEVDISDSDVRVDLHLTSPFCPAIYGFKICQDIHDNLADGGRRRRRKSERLKPLYGRADKPAGQQLAEPPKRWRAGVRARRRPASRQRARRVPIRHQRHHHHRNQHQHQQSTSSTSQPEASTPPPQASSWSTDAPK